MDGILSGMGLFADKDKKETTLDNNNLTGTSTLNKTQAADSPRDAAETGFISNASVAAPSTPAKSVAATPAPLSSSNDRKEPMNAKPATPAAPTPSPSSSNNVSLSSETSPSAVIGSKITFKGELSGDEDLLIQGAVEGTVTLKGNRLTIGKLGKVKANLSAQNIIIDGTVEGDLSAEDHISINASSIVKGNIVADRVTLEDGAKFRGSIDMDVESAPSPASLTRSDKI